MNSDKGNSKTGKPVLLSISQLALPVLMACFVLFYIDKDTHSVSDLFKKGNLAALLIYFTPTFLISNLVFNYFSKKRNFTTSMVLALVIGIPLGFFLVIETILLLR